MLWLPGGSESFSSIVKIPLLFSSAYLVYRAVSPPNPVAGKSATAAYDGKHDTLSATTTWMALASVARVRRTHILFHAFIPYYLFQSVHWLNAITESAIIIGSRYPSYLPPMLLRLLLREPQRDVSDIRLTPIWLSGCLLMISGSLIRLSCYRTLGRLFTWDLTIKDDHNLVTSGPYAVVRHPSYTGGVILNVGAVLCYLGKGSWFFSYGGLETFSGKVFAVAWAFLSLSVPLLLLGRVNVEDEVLHEHFGEEWVAYAHRTPYKLILFVY